MSAFNTINTKDAHYGPGFFTTGSGPLKVLILGSCRIIPYLNYFHYLNGDNRFTVNVINVVNYMFTADGNLRDGANVVTGMRDRRAMIDMVKETNWFIHERTQNFDFLNTDREKDENIWKFGMKAEVDVAIPNFNDIFIMFQEFMDINPLLRDLMRADIKAEGRLSADTIEKVSSAGRARMNDFLYYCSVSSLPEFGKLFELTWQNTRYFWTGSHISNRFSIEVMKLMNAKFLHINVPQAVWKRAESEDLYATPHTRITKYDREAYGINWPQPTEPLKI